MKFPFITFLVLVALGAGCSLLDAAGEAEVENGPLEVTILVGPAEITSSDSVELSFACNRPECSFRCQLNEGNERDCQDEIRYENLLDGAYTFFVRAIFEGESSEPATWQWTVDEEPRVIDLEGPDSFTDSTSATFTFGCSKEGCTFACRYGEEEFSSCQSGETITGLTTGEHRFEVRARSALGTIGPVRDYTWKVSTEAPQVENLEGPESLTNSTVATFTFQCSSSPCQYQCRFNDEPAEDCLSGYEITEIEDGNHTFGVRAIDLLGRASVEARWNWRVDTLTPEVINLIGPEGPTNSDTATFTFQCSKDDCTFYCSIESDDFSTEEQCLSGYSQQNLPDGSYTFSVRAEDNAGNTSSVVQTLEWSIDREVPIVENLTGPEGLTNQTTATFSYGCSKADCSYECTLDGPSQAGLVTCSAQGATITSLLDGDYEFTVLVSDSVGNQSSSSHVWQIDTVAPEVSITNGPESFSNQGSPGFTFQCSKSPCELQCTLSGQTGSQLERACDFTDTFAGLADDTYTLVVVGQDAAGNEGEANFEWTVKTTPPIIEFTALPSASSDRILSSIEFNCVGELCSFECALDYLDLDGNLVEGDFESCDSHLEVYSKADGDYTFFVQAIDLAGNLGASSHSWTVELAGFAGTSFSRDHQCGVSTDSTLWCWGFNESGKLGLGNSSNAVQPTQLLANDPDLATGWTQVAVGYNRSCALREDSTVWCWGRNFASNNVGILGTGSTASSVNSPQQVAKDTALETGWAFLSSSDEATCGIREDGTLWCWGLNTQGQLGIGSSAPFATSPQQVGSASDWIHISLKISSSCGIREGGSLWCWGSNFRGKLGVGDTAIKLAPTRVGTSLGFLTGWSDVTVGIGVTCGIREDSTLWCWGSNSFGMLGDGTTTDRLIPTLVGEDTNNSTGWKSVAPGSDHSCAIKEDHSAWCWGATGFLLAQGNEDPSIREYNPVPINLGGALPNDWYTIQSSEVGSCAWQHDLSYFCWGTIVLPGNTSNQPVPLRISFP